MSLNIKNPEAERLAREVADQTGETVTGAILRSLQERLERLRARDGEAASERLKQIRKIAAGSRQLWVEPYLSTAHGDLLYDELGLPR